MTDFGFVLGIVLGSGLTIVVPLLAALYLVMFRPPLGDDLDGVRMNKKAAGDGGPAAAVLHGMLTHLVDCLTGVATKPIEERLPRPATASRRLHPRLSVEGEELEAHIELQHRMENDPRVPEEVKAYCRAFGLDAVVSRTPREETRDHPSRRVASNCRQRRTAAAIPAYLQDDTPSSKSLNELNSGLHASEFGKRPLRKGASDLSLASKAVPTRASPRASEGTSPLSVTDGIILGQTAAQASDISSYQDLSRWYKDKAPGPIGHDFSLDTMKLHDFEHPLCLVAREVLGQLALDRFLAPADLHRFFVFVESIGDRYNQCSYHNELHAADVTNRLCGILDYLGVARCSQLEAFSAVVAAIIHDVDHGGLSNNYQVRNDTDLAVRWHGMAVLENHSLEVAYGILRQPSCNFLPSLSPADQATFFSNVTAIVLATDMAVHFDICELFQARVVQLKKQNIEVKTDSPATRPSHRHVSALLKNEDKKFYESLSTSNRLLALKLAMKCADLGHCCTPLGQHLQWCSRLEEEFFVQGRMERDAGLSISPLCDPDKEGLTAPQIQAGFFHGLVFPLVSTFVKAFPSCQPLQAMSARNAKHWDDYSREEE